jgi:hypothetical protein
MATDWRFSIASARRAAAACMSRTLPGSGISAFKVGLSMTGTSSSATPRPASTRPSSSGKPCRWLMAAARNCASPESLSRHW